MLTKVLAVIAMFIAAAYWGFMMGHIFPHPFDYVLAFVGGFVIGMIGWPLIRKL